MTVVYSHVHVLWFHVILFVPGDLFSVFFKVYISDSVLPFHPPLSYLRSHPYAGLTAFLGQIAPRSIVAAQTF